MFLNALLAGLLRAVLVSITAHVIYRYYNRTTGYNPRDEPTIHNTIHEHPTSTGTYTAIISREHFYCVTTFYCIRGMF